ncbi:MAG: hypothetical protein LBS49_05260 [Candidatus Accumulibacter sp.]|jgi:hypothetical protein|nr:hypothetical protein [Accumulibacter sp.]
MPLCASEVSDKVMNGEGNGYINLSYIAVMHPQPADLSGCPILISTPADESSGSIFDLSAGDGTAIAYAIAAVWIAAFSWRVLYKLLK